MIDRFGELCKALHLAHVPSIVEHRAEPQTVHLLSEIFQEELDKRELSKKLRFTKLAKFPSEKRLEEYEWHRNIQLPSSSTREELISLDFIRNNENAVFVGAPGTGKTHLATALGIKACEEGYETRFWRVSELVSELEKSWKKQQIHSLKKKFDKTRLIILDEMGYVPFTKEGSELLFQLISEWYETKSVIITSNLEFSSWNKVFIDPRLTAALVDRLIHHAHILSFTGESYRLKNALSKT